MPKRTRKSAAPPTLHGVKSTPKETVSAVELRERLVTAQSVVTGLRQQVVGRDATIRQLEAERDVAQARAVELAEALAQACATPASVIAERDLYRAALADVEAALHRLGMNCGCAGHEDASPSGK